jgi:small subunit ribosomal protein S17
MKPNKKNSGKKFVGKVISDKMAKTVVVEISNRLPHPKYRKVVSSKSKMYADNKVKAKTGDIVEIQETRPISKLKRFTVIKVISK